MVRSLAAFPEELLARILTLSLLPPRNAADLFPPRNRIAPLLVSRQFFRVASPLFYHTLHFRSSCQASCVLDTLTRQPALANAVRRIVFGAIWHDSAAVLALCGDLQDIDICLDAGPGNPNDLHAREFCHALERQHTIKHLTIRKDPAVYLTHPRPVYVLQRLAQAVRRWANLETVHFAFRISCSPSTLPLAQALSVAPCLRSVCAQVPAVWNNLFLTISSNLCLEKVMLYMEPMSGSVPNRPTTSVGSAVIKGGYICDDIEHAVLGTTLYMMEAKKHARLSELIKAGTLIVRTRAHTTIAAHSTSTAGGTPLGASRAKELADELMSGRENSSVMVVQPFSTTRRTYTQDI